MVARMSPPMRRLRPLGLLSLAVAAPLAGCGGDDALLSSDVDRLSGAEVTWAAAASMPSGRAHHTATRIAGRIIVAGGLEAVDDVVAPTTRIDAYDLDADRWESIGEMQQARDAHQALALDAERVLLYGSFLGDVAHEVFDFDTGVSTPTTDDPALFRPALAALLDGGALLAGGSLDPFEDDQTAQVWRLDPVTLAWRQLPPLEQPLAHITLATLVDGRIALAGEASFLGNDPELRVLLFDPQDESWTDARPTLGIEVRSPARGVALSDLRLMILGTVDTGAPQIEILGSSGGEGSELWVDVTPAAAADLFGAELEDAEYIALVGSVVARVDGDAGSLTRFSPTTGEVVTSGGGPRALPGRAIVAHADGGALVLGGNVAYVDTRGE
jgi:hypothetical protein